jgi:hypothetical protein
MFKKLLIGETILDKAAKKEASTLQQDPSKRVNLKLKNSPGHNTHTTCITVSNKTWTLSMIFSKPKTSVSRILRQKDQLPLLLS